MKNSTPFAINDEGEIEEDESDYELTTNL